MKVLFSPEFQGHVFLGLNKKNTYLMDAMVCDTMRLIGMLELHMGIHVPDQPGHYRMVKYFKAMSEYMKQYPDNALAASFKLSNLGTAEQALKWRDHLLLDKWQPAESAAISDRLDVLAGTEAYFDSPGMPDRLKAILQCINEKKPHFDDLEIELPCELDILHPSVAELLTTLEKHGAQLSIRTRCGNTDSNLSRVAQLLQSTSNEIIKLEKGDSSLLIYKFSDEKAANEYLALKGDELKADLWINDANKSLDNWLRMMGKPTMGSSMAASSPQVLQLFVLGIDMMKEPLNIQSLISWLYCPMQPFGTFFGGILAETIIGEGGYRNEKCQRVVKDYIAGKYTYHDQEEDKQLTEREIAKRNAQEEKERKALVGTYLPSFEVTDSTVIKAVKIKSYLNSLSAWARSRAHFLAEKPSNEGWCSQLNSLAQMCDTFVLLMDSADMGDDVDIKQVESWISTLYKGETFMQYASQKGSLELVDSPAKMAAQSECTVWMNFIGGDVARLDCSFLYPTEKEKIKEHITLWDESKEMGYHQMMQLLPFQMTEKQIILVVTDYTNGEPSPKHPAMVRLESQVENLDDIIIRPNLLDEKTENVRIVTNNNTQPLIRFDHAELLRWPDHLSPTTISTLVEYPLDYMMERMLNIVNTGPSSIKEVKPTKGDVAHAVIAALFASRDGKPCQADEIEQRINNEFDEQVRRAIESCGAILDLPENRLDADLLKEQLRKCLDILLEIIRDNHLTVTGCEHQVKTDMGLIKNDKDWDMIGYIDMTLEDENHHPVVFDFKWTSSKSYYRDLLTANRSTQLELYRIMLGAEKRDAVERTAYFLMPEGHLYSKEEFKGPHCTQMDPENTDNIVEQLKRSYFYRKQQFDEGKVEIGEQFPLNMLEYFNDTEEKHLFPLSKDDKTGMERPNIFSNYLLFKGLQEGQ